MFKFTNNLPKWCLTGSNPAFYDTDSATVVEQTARIYGAMKTLISESEKAINELDKAMNDFKTGITADQETFKAHIDKIMHDYIIMLDEKIKLQDKKIDESIVFIKDNLSEGVTQVINQMKESGELDEVVADSFNQVDSRVTTLENTEYSLVLEEGTENLILQKTIKEGE